MDSANSVVNFNGTSWGLSTIDYYSSPSSITDSPNGNYNDDINSAMELSNSIDLSDVVSAQLSFYAKWKIETGWDYAQFEISTDNGSTWTPQCGEYTKTGNSQQNIDGEPMYDGFQNTWVKEKINLSDYLGQTIKFRFQMVSDGHVNEDGFYFDDIEIKAIFSNPANVVDNQFLNLSIYPNPFQESLIVSIPNILEHVVISIYSIKGQVLNVEKTNKPNTIIDLKNLSPGIYFVKTENDKFTKTIKVIKN